MFRRWAELYARDEAAFTRDFQRTYQRAMQVRTGTGDGRASGWGSLAGRKGPLSGRGKGPPFSCLAPGRAQWQMEFAHDYTSAFTLRLCASTVFYDTPLQSAHVRLHPAAVFVLRVLCE